MRKFFVVLMVALVALTMVGCRLVENSDDGADIAPVPVTATAGNVTLAPVVVVPAAVAAANILGKISAADLTLTIGGKVLHAASWVTNADGSLTVTFETYTVPSSTFTSSSNNATITGTLDLGGGQTVAINMPVSNVCNTSTATNAATNGATITVTITNGVLGVTVTTTPSSGGTSTGTTDTTNASATTITNADFYVASVLYGTASLTADTTTPVTIATLTPTFVVNLSADFGALPEWSLSCKNLTSGNTQTLTQANAQVTVTADHTNKKITFALISTTAPYALKAAQKYQVTFSGTLTSAVGAKTITDISRTFQTQ